MDRMEKWSRFHAGEPEFAGAGGCIPLGRGQGSNTSTRNAWYILDLPVRRQRQPGESLRSYHSGYQSRRRQDLVRMFELRNADGGADVGHAIVVADRIVPVFAGQTAPGEARHRSDT